MIVTIGGIPVYNAIISDEDTGMYKISLVDDPAVMSNFQAFDKQHIPQMYAIQDEEKRLVRGVVMRADFPIYRYDAKMGEYYIIYKADQIRKMAEKYLVESRQNDVNLMHEEGSDVDGVQMVQYFIKGDGISVEGFDDCADGSLFAEFHVANDDVWAEIKAGTYKGFSLEGIFDLQPETDADEVQSIVDLLDGAFRKLFKHSNDKIMSKLTRLKAALAKAFAALGNVTTDKGVLAWDGDEDLKAGDSVYIEDAEGNRTPAEDGDYKTEDGKTIVVVGGQVSEIRDPEAEVDSDPVTDPAPAAEEMETITTDKGDLTYTGDLAVGTDVFVVGEDGESAPAADGDYKVDGKTIKVVDGKVSEIVEDAPATTEEAMSRFKRLVQAFSDSYQDKQKRILDAIISLGFDSYGWLVEAGDDYAIYNTWSESGEAYTKFTISWDADGNAIASNPTKVVPAFVEETPAPAAEPVSDPAEAEALKAQIRELQEKIEKMSKLSAAKPAHEEVKQSGQASKTGIKGLDNLAKILSA